MGAGEVRKGYKECGIQIAEAPSTCKASKGKIDNAEIKASLSNGESRLGNLSQKTFKKRETKLHLNKRLDPRDSQWPLWGKTTQKKKEWPSRRGQHDAGHHSLRSPTFQART